MQEELAKTTTTTMSTLEASIAETIAARPDLMQLQMENESIKSDCRVRPRNLARIKQQLLEMLDAFPDLAKRCIYVKNCGKALDPVTKKWTTRFAEGLSIRAAEVLAEAYQYNRVRCDVIYPLDAERMTAKVEAVFVDFQNGRLWQDSGTLSRRYMGWDGDPKNGGVRIEKIKDEDSFLALVCKGEASKRIRECILRCVSPVLKQWFQDECMKRRESLIDAADSKKLIDAFHALGVTQSMIERLLGRTKAMGWTEADLTLLRGIYMGIKEGDQTVDEVFSDDADAPPAPESKPEAEPKAPEDKQKSKNEKPKADPVTATPAEVPSDEGPVDVLALAKIRLAKQHNQTDVDNCLQDLYRTLGTKLTQDQDAILQQMGIARKEQLAK